MLAELAGFAGGDPSEPLSNITSCNTVNGLVTQAQDFLKTLYFRSITGRVTWHAAATVLRCNIESRTLSRLQGGHDRYASVGYDSAGAWNLIHDSVGPWGLGRFVLPSRLRVRPHDNPAGSNSWLAGERRLRYILS